jgi:hypothetical protein
MALALGAAGCHKTTTVETGVAANDPASANFAPTGPQPRGRQRLPERVLADRESAQPYQQGEYVDPGSYDAPAPPQDGMYEADQAPPPLPEYAQPVANQRGVIWTPGYWQHGPSGYFWVPGAWVQPPYTGALWTPGYWAATGPRFRFHPGFWGRHVGYYGGVPYGYGYPGRGYVGGYWSGDRFLYNQAVNHVDVNIIHDVYSRPEPVYSGVRVSFAGPGGILLAPIAAELIALHEEHERPLRVQFDLERRGLYGGGGPGFNDGPRVIERPVIIEERRFDDRGGPPGHAYGLYKEHHDNGNHFGEFKEHGDNGNHFGRDGDGPGRGEGHDEDRGHGGGEGHGHGR